MIGINDNDNSRISFSGAEISVTEFNLGLVDSSVVNADEARINLGHIDQAIETLSSKRAKAGSYQNSIQTAINNLETTNINETSAMSRIMDADMAYESSGKLNAASSVLAQSSQFSAMALKLLQD